VPLLVQLLKEQVLQAQRSALGWDAGLAVNLVTVMTAAAQGGQAGAQAVLEAPGKAQGKAVLCTKCTKAEQAAEPTQPTKGKGKAQGKAAKPKPAPQPGRWVDRDCNAALNMQRIGESKWRPLELCWWPEQGKLPAKGKEYPELGYKRLQDQPSKAQQQQQQQQQQQAGAQ
ncbi:hypothetical protein QJQ45_022495, partial [Haematococcus lacustris]